MIAKLSFNSYYMRVLTRLSSQQPYQVDTFVFLFLFLFFCWYVSYRFKKQVLSVFELSCLKNVLDSTAHGFIVSFFVCAFTQQKGLQSLESLARGSHSWLGGGAGLPESCIAEPGPWQLCWHSDR